MAAHPEVGVVIVEQGLATASPRLIVFGLSEHDFVRGGKHGKLMMRDVPLGSKPLRRSSVMSRYYPGFLAAFFIVLLRIAIGWHFLYEGCEKFESTVDGKEPFSAEIYLRNANGPLGPYFRGMLPDVNSLAMLDPVRLKAAWKDDVSGSPTTIGFTPEQRDKAQKILDESLRWADYWFNDPENVEKRQEVLPRPGSGRSDRAATRRRCRSRTSGPGTHAGAWTPTAGR